MLYVLLCSAAEQRNPTEEWETAWRRTAVRTSVRLIVGEEGLDAGEADICPSYA